MIVGNGYDVDLFIGEWKWYCDIVGYVLCFEIMYYGEVEFIWVGVEFLVYFIQFICDMVQWIVCKYWVFQLFIGWKLVFDLVIILCLDYMLFGDYWMQGLDQNVDLLNCDFIFNQVVVQSC